MYNRLDTIPVCDKRTDRQTDILPGYSPRYAYVSRGKNCAFLFLSELHQISTNFNKFW